MAKLIPIIGAAVVALLLGAGGGWYIGSSAAKANAPIPAEATQKEEENPAFSYAVKDKVVNLADPGAKRYLKVNLVLGIPETPAAAAKRKAPPTPEDEKKFNEEFGSAHGAQINDALTSILSSKRTDEVTTPEGRERLRQEILTRINAFMPKDQHVSKVYFTDFIIQ